MNNKIKRLIAATIDLAFISILTIPLILYFDNSNYRLWRDMTQLLFFGLFLNKDCTKGISIGKRLFNFVTIYKGRPASSLKCLIRNVTLLIYPIEALILLINPQAKRIGDYFAGTTVIKQDHSLKAIKQNSNLLLRDVLFTLLLTGLILVFVNYFYGIL
ncbi:RDD family protein [Rhodocytophaga rosea]|uniref:RDD family protein n=1 Tax=Rhodocytophaga rosea TaxID=2704465 RepID=A0A6C0GGG8_9BACT|nr:RDD family protein [Rhodocytophaga rosea]QHT66924.1 RDD family protein [Rhodocytophaga rosea]